MMRTKNLILLALAITCTTTSIVFGEDQWTSFQNGGVLSAESTELPINWSPTSGVLWQANLAGYGQSTPVAHGDRVYVTSVSGDMKQQIHVQALSRSDGSEIWRFNAKNSTPEENTNYVSRAAPSPVCDQQGVIAFFEGGNLVALDPQGKVRWKLDLVQQFGDVQARHSLAASLEQDEQSVFIWVERETNPYLLAVSKQSGEVAWKSEGLGTTSWSSPRLVPVEGGAHLVVSGVGKIGGYDPKTGRRLWLFEDISGNATPTPVPVGGGRFLIGSSGGRQNTGGNNPAANNGLLQIKSSDQGFDVSWVWRAKRATSSFGSPLPHHGKAYFVSSVGVLYCLDLETGKEVFAERSPGGSVWATPLGAGNQVYLFGKDGQTTIITDGDSMNVIANNRAWEKAATTSGGKAGQRETPRSGHVLYAATPLGSQLLIRRGDRLYLVGQ